MTDEAKAAKAQSILDKAKEMLLTTDYSEIKMADIAKAMGISNGLLFVYFKTKETLFMNLLWREYEGRLSYLKSVAQKERIESFEDIKRILLSELEFIVDNNPLYIKLNTMRTIVFEKNTDFETLYNMKKSLFGQASELTMIFSQSGVLTQEQIIDILFIEDAIITGCKLEAALPPNVVEVISQLGMGMFRRDFKNDVIDAFSCFLDGYENKIGR
jgi:AcrR family transcriptional regulator